VWAFESGIDSAAREALRGLKEAAGRATSDAVDYVNGLSALKYFRDARDNGIPEERDACFEALSAAFAEAREKGTGAAGENRALHAVSMLAVLRDARAVPIIEDAYDDAMARIERGDGRRPLCPYSYLRALRKAAEEVRSFNAAPQDELKGRKRRD
jgi:hypothetical protein